MFHNILIPLDGSAFGDRALAFATDLAEAAAPVTLLMVTGPGATPEEADAARSYLRDRQQSLVSAGLQNVKVELREGDPVLAILDVARELVVDLVVMATRGHGAREAEGLGSVAAGVLGAAPCPVFMVRVARPEPPRTTAEERWQSEGGANVG